MLIDNHGRTFGYIRIGLTDQCNLRCQYCMPAGGLSWIPKKELMSLEELKQILRMIEAWGIKKVRFTGGEPLVRKDFLDILSSAHEMNFDSLHLTTNGVLTERYLPDLKDNGIDQINFSLDSLDPKKFELITRRDQLSTVLSSIQEALRLGFKVNVNTVLLSDTTEEECLALMKWSFNQGIHLRFIEEMPFNGQGKQPDWHWNWRRIEDMFFHHYPELVRNQKAPHATSVSFGLANQKGSVGYIAAYSRTFCGTCNRLRLTPEGHLYHCLYSEKYYPLLQVLRSGLSKDEIFHEVNEFVKGKSINGFEAEKENQNFGMSMARMGG
jgi:molybdenum cofactor biosynthesis protein A